MTAYVHVPTLLYDDECGVCRRVAGWVRRSLHGAPTLIVRPIGNDPDDLARLHPGLDIWDAYAIVHLLLPDGSMRTGGAAVTEVLRTVPATSRLAPLLDLRIGGVRIGAAAVDAAYTLLAEIRPLLGCESCGSTSPLVRSLQHVIRRIANAFRTDAHALAPHVASASPRSTKPAR